MKLTNDSYLILMGTRNFTERYYRDKAGWFKVSARGRKFRMTAEQVLNHLLPALAGVKPNLTIQVEHRQSLLQGERTVKRGTKVKRRRSKGGRGKRRKRKGGRGTLLLNEGRIARK